MAENEKQAKNNAKVVDNRKIKRARMLTIINVNRIQIVIDDEKIPAEWIYVYVSQFLS
jgi:DeoR/GlpR family transcriptional regulator of sugar metabolism